MIDSLDVGGAEQLVARLGRAPERTFEMSVAVLRSWDTPQIPDVLRAAGVPIELFEITDGGLTVHPAGWYRFVRFVRAGGFDVVHTHVNSSHVVGLLTAALLRIPSVATLHGLRSGAITWKERLRMQIIRRRAAAVIAVGRTVAVNHAADLAPRAAVIIPNPAPRPATVPRRSAAAVRDDLGVPVDAVLAIAVGRLVEEKNHQLLLDAMAVVHAEEPRARLIVAGPGRLRRELTEHARALGLEDVVRFLGPRDDVPDLLEASDLFVSSSASEGMPLSLLEAMAVGLPVVATDVGDCREVVGEAGALVAPGDPGALAEAILTLVTDDDLRVRCGRAAQARVEEEFGVGPWVRRLAALYERVVADAR